MNAAAASPSRLPLRRRLLYLLLLLLAALLLAELLLSWLIAETKVSYRASEGGVLMPFIPGAEADLISDEFHVRYRINALGYRDRARGRNRQGRRLILLGDSFGEGWGVAQDKTFAAQLERALSQPERAIELWNAARHGGNPLWYVIQARHVRERFGPELLIVQLFDNDLWDLGAYRHRFRFDAEGRVQGMHKLAERPGALELFWSRRQLPRWLKRLRRMLKDRERMHREPFYRAGARAPRPPSFEALPDLADWSRLPFLGFYDPEQAAQWVASLDLERRLLHQLGEECREAGVELLLLYIPDRGVFHAFPTLAARRKNNPHFQVIEEVARALELPLFDGQELLATVPDPASLYFRRDGHLNEQGHTVLAEELSKRLSAVLGK